MRRIRRLPLLSGERRICVRQGMMKIGSRGFSLLEVLITLVAFTVTIVALLTAFNIGIAGTADIENMRTAVYLAQARMEAIRNMKFSAISASLEAADQVFNQFRVRVDVTGTGPKTISVVVTWTAKGSPVSFTLATQRSETIGV